MEIYFQFQKQQVIFSNFCKNFEKKLFFLLFSEKIFPFLNRNPRIKSPEKRIFSRNGSIFFTSRKKNVHHNIKEKVK